MLQIFSVPLHENHLYLQNDANFREVLIIIAGNFVITESIRALQVMW